MSIITITSPSTLIAGEGWYVGGNLHRKNLQDWNSATSANRLATATDMASLVLGARKIKQRGGLPYLRIKAAQLVRCINEVAVDYRLGHMAVAEIAASCQILMNWHK